MARGPCTFKQSDVTRAVKSAQAAGLIVSQITLDREGHIVMTTQPQADKVPAAQLKNWDGVVA